MCAAERGLVAADHDGGGRGVHNREVAARHRDQVVRFGCIGVPIACRIAEDVVGHMHAAVCCGIGSEGGGVVAATALKIAQRSAADLNVRLRERAAGFAQREADGGRLTVGQTGFVAADRDGRWGGVCWIAHCVGRHRDGVVDFCAIDVQISSSISEAQTVHLDDALTHTARHRREGGGVGIA